MEVVLDTNFILTCLKNKIDILEAENFGKLIIPELVIKELEKLASKGKLKERELASLALQIIEKNKDNFEIIKLKKKFVDAGIIRYVKNKKDVAVATLDKKLKQEVKGKAKILTIKGRKKLIFE